MKFYYNKQTLEGRWFLTHEVRVPEFVPSDYTDKVPPHTNVYFDEEAGDWVVNPVPELPEQDSVPEYGGGQFEFDDNEFI